jgi:hypothetical protein
MTSVMHLHPRSSKCRPNYDAEAVWPLVGLSRWVLAFIEKIMRECVKSCDMRLLQVETDSSSDLFGTSPRMCLLSIS